MTQLTSKWIRNWEPQFTRLCLKLFPKKTTAHSFEKPLSILVVKSCCLGDAILSLYSLREFHEKNPQCRIEVLVTNRIDEVYKSAPFVDQVHVLPITGSHLSRELISYHFLIKTIQVFYKLRRKKFQCMIDMELYRTFGPLVARILGIGYSRGFAVPGAPAKAHDVNVFRGKADPEWKCFYGVLGLPVPTSDPRPLFPIHPDRLLIQQPQIGLVYGSSFNWPQKRWPMEHFIELGLELQRFGYKIRLYGTSHESELGRQIERALPGCQNTTGNHNFSQLIDSLQTCSLVVGNDTGTLHAAAAAGVRVITLFGPTSPLKWNPITSRPVYVKELECRPCYYLSSMPDCSHRSCLTHLDPQLVLSVVLEELSGKARKDANAPDWKGILPYPTPLSSITPNKMG